MSIKSWFAKRRFGVVVGACVVAIAALAALTAARGIRLRYVEFDSAAATESNQQIRLHLSLPIKSLSAEQVSITPSVPLSVAVEGEVVIISLKDQLHYQAEYTLKITGVAGEYGRQRGDIEYRFSTLAAAAYFIRRNYDSNSLILDSKSDDQIMKIDLATGKETQIFQANKIQEFVLIGDELVVSMADKNGKSQLNSVNITTKKVNNITLAKTGVAAKLRASADGTSFGYILGDQPASKGGELYIVRAQDKSTRTVAGAKNAVDWQPSPDGRLAAVLTADDNLLLLDASGKRQPRPLGQAQSLGNFSGDRRAISYARRSSGFAAYDLAANQPDRAGSLESYAARLIMLSNSATLAENYPILRTAKSEPEIVYTDGARRMSYRAGKNQRVTGLAASPNRQFITVETVANDTPPYDNYPANGRNYPTTTRILASENGRVIREIDGFDVRWRANR